MDNKKIPVISGLESNRKNESKIFGESRFRPENMPVKKPLTPESKKEIFEKLKTKKSDV